MAGSVAAFVLACLPIVAVSSGASAEDELKENKQELHQTKDKIRSQLQKIRKLQRHMNGLATRISRAQSEIVIVERRIDKLEREITILRVRASLLQAKLDQRNREAYMFGSAPVLYLLTATSAAEAASRMSFITEMNRRDAVLAAEVHETTDRLARGEAEVVRGRQVIEMTKRRLELDQEELRRAMAESRRLVAGLRDRVEQIQYEISKIRPFSVCPLAGPHAIADDFGILVHHPKNEGGDHIHQGNDIYAAMGVPIVAPFDGTAVTATNHVGGMAVKVYGDFGYVYNAHLSRFGQLGSVQAGDVIGYVGATGNAGGPHDHFEWHPGNGSAVDPHGFLLMVCESGSLPF
ncbi:MAG TPA: peptidoglycan DD-metalloendopeptidase family protein [Actinomycetota bacterium]|nr:peptidoglycan DD-metalloendopeptidase family protein [Actinomycetota bacterium]